MCNRAGYHRITVSMSEAGTGLSVGSADKLVPSLMLPRTEEVHLGTPLMVLGSATPSVSHLSNFEH